MKAVLVSHPHNAAFAGGLAAALARSGRLAAYATGVAAREGSVAGAAFELLARRRPIVRNRIVSGIPRGKLIAIPGVELAARGAAWGAKKIGAPLSRYDAIYVAHDAIVSKLPWPRATTTVYAYEDAALSTFRRASREGLERVWDLPLPHYLAIEETWREEARRWPGSIDYAPHSEPAWKRQRKDEELGLATRVSVASSFTKQSLERLDLAARVFIVPYGFPIELFSPRTTRPTGPFTVLSVGTHDLRKGTPYLLEAWKRAAIPDAELHLVGPMRLAKSFLQQYEGSFRHWPHVAKAELGARYAGADVLAFPTLGDGFGLVIQEAMCSGTPVITTPCGGGPECITDGVDGWLVPPRDVDALVERLRACAADREKTFRMGQVARARAERWTWRDAGDALGAALA